MKEFVEKLIGRLEEYQENNTFCKSEDDYELGIFNTCEKAIEIVNQLAEEYNNKDCSQCSRRSWYQKGYADAEKKFAEEYKSKHNDSDLMIVESLPSLYPMKEFEKEALQRVIYGVKKECNNDFCEWSKQGGYNFYLHKTSCGTEDTFMLTYADDEKLIDFDFVKMYKKSVDESDRPDAEGCARIPALRKVFHHRRAQFLRCLFPQCDPAQP